MEKYQGLTDSEVTARIKEFGYNELPTQKRKNIFVLFAKLLKEPMLFLLLLTGVIYLLLGEPQDSIVLFSTIVVIIGMTLYQENRTESALHALKELSSPKALVIRNGEQKRISGRDVVPDDIILLQEGDRVPADAIVLSSLNLLIDESILTGESLPVRKSFTDMNKVTIQALATLKPGGDDSYFVFSGTLIAQGSGTAKVIATGVHTQMGLIGKSLESIVDEDFLLKREMGKIVKVFAIFGGIACTLLFGIYYYLNHNLLESFLAGLTLAMALLPEEFPVVLLIFLTLGAWRISKKHVLARNNQAIETLGATSVLCVDKTGTLTFNHMDLASIVSSKGIFEFSAKVKDLDKLSSEILFYSKLASKRGAFDPLEKEINLKFEKFLGTNGYSIKGWHLLKEYSLSKSLFAISRVWSSPDAKHNIVAAKGSPEAILDMCKIPLVQKKEIMALVFEMSKKGQRVLGVAKSTFSEDKFHKSQKDYKFEFLGLIGFIDDIRPNVYESVQECYLAGIKVIMITGDYPGTAQYIASKAGIKNTEDYLTGEDLESLSKEELQEKIRDINIFARIIPDQKLKIVEALKANGEIVAMTGDGVNDGPALKAAHIGLAMGERGTDVARESADMVLLDDNFISIVSAVKLGRRIYDNLQKAVSYIFSIHIPIAGAALFPVLLGLPPILYPIHIAFFELIVDPACSTVYEGEHSEAGIMKRGPRNLKQPLFDRSHIIIGIFQGLFLLVTIMYVYMFSLSLGKDENTARAMAFVTMVLCNLVLIIANLSSYSIFEKFVFHKNKALYIITGLVFGSLMVVFNVPFFLDVFGFAKFNLIDLLLIVSTVSICYIFLEFLKLFRVNGGTKKVIK